MKTPLTLITAALLAACSPAPTTSSGPKPVYVQTMGGTADGAREQLTATLQARHEVELGFRTGGRVLRRLVEVGQPVRAGELLAELDPSDYQLALQAAEAQLQAARLDATQQQRDAGRMDRLVVDGSVGQSDQERQRTGAEAAAQRVQGAAAQRDLARQRLGYAQLRAPTSGVITQLRLEPGQVLAEGQPALQLARVSELELQVDLPESLAREAKTLQAEALNQRWRLRELAPSSHPQTRTVRARFAPAQPLAWQAGLLGSSVSLSLSRPAPGSATFNLPSTALLARDGQAQVWRVLEGGKLEAQAVKLMARDRERVTVSGIAPGSQVVLLGAHKLDAGQIVRPVPLERAP
jgi:RND family efflux transporter MFP subunit